MNHSQKKILFLASNPKDTQRLHLDEEVRKIDEGLQRSKQRKMFKLEQKWAVRFKDMRRALLDYRPHIVHFSGHGAKDMGIVLQNDKGQANVITTETLAEFFELFPDVECVLLNACYSKAQATAIGKHVNFVVGMSHEITDEASTEFSVAFYDALGAGESVLFAYKLACNAIRAINVTEHLIPTLEVRESVREQDSLSNMLPQKGFLSEFTKNLPNNPFETFIELYSRFRRKHLRQALKHKDYISAYNCLKKFLTTHHIEFRPLVGYSQQNVLRIVGFFEYINRFSRDAPMIDLLMDQSLAKSWLVYVETFHDKSINI